MKTKIEWADDTENAASGCSEAVLPNGKMDPACVNCYARLQSARCASMGQALYDGVAIRSGNTARWTGVFRWDRDMLRRKFDRMKGGHRVFLGSMTDLWHDQHDPALLVALAHEIRRLGDRKPEQRPHLITLTKRADRLLAWQREHFPDGLPEWVWPGVTAGCQEAADLRVPLLLHVKAKGPRVVSVEPMTGPVDLSCIATPEGVPWERGPTFGAGRVAPCLHVHALRGWSVEEPARRKRIGRFAGLNMIEWVIAGGESGAKARPSNLEWFRALRDQCVSAGVPFHFKQWGEWAPDYYIEDDDPPGTPPRQAAESMSRVGKISAGRLLDGRTWDEVPHV